MSEVEEIGRLVLECAHADTDPEPWEQLYRFLKRKNYKGVLKGVVKEAIEFVEENRMIDLVEEALKELSGKIRESGFIICACTGYGTGRDNLFHFKDPETDLIEGQRGSLPICRRWPVRPEEISLTALSYQETPKICGACLELLPENFLETESYKKVMKMGRRVGLEFDYPWDWEGYM